MERVLRLMRPGSTGSGSNNGQKLLQKSGLVVALGSFSTYASMGLGGSNAVRMPMSGCHSDVIICA